MVPFSSKQHLIFSSTDISIFIQSLKCDKSTCVALEKEGGETDTGFPDLVGIDLGGTSIVEWITCGTPAFVQLSRGHRAVNTRCNTWFQTIRQDISGCEQGK